ncbi:hypothetical protein P170DRAFT_432857 [Aspergillus steynii IBT 23096]|uniref:VHS domain-containing protein n=1 Tax=Aspergillus steynii IBT 23096 TaxID=1392250 RepID=A0A2I2GR12_9EURO|nr:uncharacterized protein P170DRAFT_432857 [Aspergillus steynii IBT 23096]PLB55319.1 hypothetical protein P170DRAFT_432857 [Aspergillus steynii IBT 23096]
MFHSSKPYSAVTVQIEVLTSEQYEVEDSSGIVDLIEAVTIQGSGPTEASRALRKKLKYGNLHRQLRALTILDFLIQNAGDRFLREFADEPLLERLRIAATDSVSDPLVKQKCKQLFGQWAASYKNTPGMGGITALYRQLPKRKQPANQAKAKVLRDANPSDEPPLGHTVSISAGDGPSTVLSGPKHKHSSSKSLKKEKKDKKEKRIRAPFNLEKEKPEILQTLASSSVASTNLLNSLKLVNRETHRVSEDAEVLNRFETCKQLRRQILRYIQNVESEEFLGSLIHANEELVTALMAFEVLDKSVDYDSDSDQDVLETGWTPDRDDVNESFAGLVINLPKPPRPARPLSISVPSSSSQQARRANDSDSDSETDEDDDEDNPFGDRNEIRTPGVEKFQPTWKEV